MDAESEDIVQNAINNLIKDRTTIVIAHRFSTIHNADKIFVFKNGSIIDSGNHNELMNKSNEYKSLYQKQLIDLMIYVYRVLTNILYPVIVLLIYFKLINKEHKLRYKEKFFLPILTLKEKIKKLLWFHATKCWRA